MTISTFKALAAHRAPDTLRIQSPQDGAPVTEQSPATEVMTDFTRVNAVTIRAQASLFQANETMIAQGVRLLLVTSDDGQLLGIISTLDTLGERPMQLLHQGKGNLFELKVSDLMHGVSDIDMLDFDEVCHANVGDLVATMRGLGQQHVLVKGGQGDAGPARVRGVFSATRISRQLGIDLKPFQTARTFAEIEAALT